MGDTRQAPAWVKPAGVFRSPRMSDPWQLAKRVRSFAMKRLRAVLPVACRFAYCVVVHLIADVIASALM
jgi:hypothetical protein